MRTTNESPISAIKSRRGFLAMSGAAGAAALVSVANAQAQSGAGSTPAMEIVAEFLPNTASDKIEAAAQRLVAEDAAELQ